MLWLTNQGSARPHLWVHQNCIQLHGCPMGLDFWNMARPGLFFKIYGWFKFYKSLKKSNFEDKIRNWHSAHHFNTIFIFVGNSPRRHQKYWWLYYGFPLWLKYFSLLWRTGINSEKGSYFFMGLFFVYIMWILISFLGRILGFQVLF